MLEFATPPTLISAQYDFFEFPIRTAWQLLSNTKGNLLSYGNYTPCPVCGQGVSILERKGILGAYSYKSQSVKFFRYRCRFQDYYSIDKITE
jgi:hypothetical protein